MFRFLNFSGIETYAFFVTRHVVPNGARNPDWWDALHQSWFASLQGAFSPLLHLWPEHLQNGVRVGRKDSAPARAGVLPANALVGEHLLTQLLGIPLQHLFCSMLEVDTISLKTTSTLSPCSHSFSVSGSASLLCPIKLHGESLLAVIGGWNLEAELHFPHVSTVKVPPSLPGFLPYALCGVSLATSENLILHLPWLLKS